MEIKLEIFQVIFFPAILLTEYKDSGGMHFGAQLYMVSTHLVGSSPLCYFLTHVKLVILTGLKKGMV